MLPFIRLGPFLLQIPELTLVLGIFLGASLAEREAKKLRLKPELVNNLTYYGFFATLVGARLAYALKYVDVYLGDPLALFSLSTTTLAINEGLLIGFGVSILYGIRKKLTLRPTLDALAPGLAAFMIFLAVSHFFAGIAYGSPTKMPWAIYLWDANRHPTQIYELFAAILIFFLAYNHAFGNRTAGMSFILTVALFAGSRVLLEAFRGDSFVLPGGFRAAQVVGLLILFLALWLMKTWENQTGRRTKNQDQPVEL
jgi:phosphatidylglycerol:prolipoprotein diacylglycerol transferase